MKGFGSSKVGSRLATQSVIQSQPLSHLRNGNSSNPPTPHNTERIGNMPINIYQSSKKVFLESDF